MPPEASVLSIDDRWIRAHRPNKLEVDPWRPFAVEVEDERTVTGSVEPVGTIFIVNRECPFTCLMCDLWRYTTDSSVPPGAIDAQVRAGLDTLGSVRHLKLYNAGNFFDDRAISPSERTTLLGRLSGLDTVIIENHPRLVDGRTTAFADRLAVDRLEVAMGLETVAPAVVNQLNKQMTLDDFARATELLVRHDIGVRAFILLRPPYQSEEEGLDWACRSIEFAFSNGVECCVVIPTRAGNGALDALAALILFTLVRCS